MNKDDTEYLHCFQSDFMFQREKKFKGQFQENKHCSPFNFNWLLIVKFKFIT